MNKSQITLMQRTGEHSRSRLVLTRRGIEALYERPRVDGGWYPKNSVGVAWPWVRDR